MYGRRDSIIHEILGDHWGDPSRYISDPFTTMDKNRWCRTIALSALNGRIPDVGSPSVLEAWTVSRFLDDDLGSCVRWFSDARFWNYGQDALTRSRAIFSILRKITLAETVHLVHLIAPTLMDDVLGALRQMHELRRVYLSFLRGSMTAHDILLSVGSWPHLQSLELHSSKQPILGDR